MTLFQRCALIWSPHAFQFTSSSHLSPSNLFNVPRCKDDSYLLFVWNKTIAAHATPVCMANSQIISATIFHIQLFCNHLYRSCILLKFVDLSARRNWHGADDWCKTEWVYQRWDRVGVRTGCAFFSKRSFFKNIFVIFLLTQVSAAYSNLFMFDFFLRKSNTSWIFFCIFNLKLTW